MKMKRAVPAMLAAGLAMSLSPPAAMAQGGVDAAVASVDVQVEEPQACYPEGCSIFAP